MQKVKKVQKSVFGVSFKGIKGGSAMGNDENSMMENVMHFSDPTSGGQLVAK